MSSISPEINNNGVDFPFGFKLKLNQVLKNGNESEVNLIRSAEENLFCGLFDVNDTDFEIIADNKMNDRGVVFGLKIENKESVSFYVKSGDKSTLKALETNGKHLHFLSQETTDGKVLVAMNAHRNGISVEESAIRCSRIKLFVEVGKTTAEKTVPFQTGGRNIEISIKTLTDKTISLTVMDNYTIEQIKCMVKDKGIPPERQRMIYGGRQLENGRNLEEYVIKNGSTIHLVLSLRGGATAVPSSEMVTTIDSVSSGPECPQIGESGVVCFGEKTDQCFETYEGFEVSDKFRIKPFVIELRMKSKYSLV